MNTVKCPHCGTSIEIQDELEKELRMKIEEEQKTEVLDLKKALDEKNQKVDEMRSQELKLREEKRKLEERESELVLETQRIIDGKRKEIEETVLKRAAEEHRFREMDKDKVINDLKKALEDAQRKASQGSQQTQGEVLELDMEETLRTAFPADQIESVKKGEEGADIRQIVKSPRGFTCGVILWEVKRTKAWSDKWLIKLKDNLRSEKADIPVIVSTVLPKSVRSPLELIDGVWVSTYDLVIPLAVLLRKNLLDVSYQKAVSTRKTEKSDLLYDYVTGHEFRQQVETLVEVYQEMHGQVIKERAAFERIWNAREGQIKRLCASTIGICGKVQGLAGSSFPQIRGLELLEPGEK